LKQRGPGLDADLYNEKGSSTTVVTALGITWTVTSRYQMKDQRLTIDGDGWVVGITQHLTLFNPEGRKDSAMDRRVEFQVTADPVTGEDVWTLTKDVGHLLAGSPCEDAIRFAANS
jgi:hypothetical protein